MLDIHTLLERNDEKNSVSTFILLRVLIDDFIRVCSVHWNQISKEEVITKIDADAYSNELKLIHDASDIN